MKMIKCSCVFKFSICFSCSSLAPTSNGMNFQILSKITKISVCKKTFSMLTRPANNGSHCKNHASIITKRQTDKYPLKKKIYLFSVGIKSMWSFDKLFTMSK